MTVSGLLRTIGLLLLWLTGSAGWPEGQYGLPMPQSGCPEADLFNWRTGTRTQHTEQGSHGSDDIHIAGIYSYHTDRITQPFCMKSTSVMSGSYTWMKGRYCIYKAAGHSCPNYFREGYVYWDDAAPFIGDTIQNTSGTLPDGEYDRNTKMYFCCRNDGLPSKPIDLPSQNPFYLLKWGDRCQEVTNMEVTEESVYWRDESSLNLDTYGGLHPKLSHSKYPVVYVKMFYCYYQPKPETHTWSNILMAVYIIAGIAGLVVIILVLTCLFQRIFSSRPKDHEENNISNASRERAFHDTAPSVEPERQYQPVPTLVVVDGEIGLVEKKRPLPASSVHRAELCGSTVTTPSSDSEGAFAGASSSEEAPMLVQNAPNGFQTTRPPAPRPPSGPPSYDDVMRAEGKLLV